MLRPYPSIDDPRHSRFGVTARIAAQYSPHGLEPVQIRAETQMIPSVRPIAPAQRSGCAERILPGLWSAKPMGFGDAPIIAAKKNRAIAPRNFKIMRSLAAWRPDSKERDRPRYSVPADPPRQFVRR